jgi:voltage-dependent potassium channel beta subunit
MFCALEGEMEYRRLGKSGLKVSELSFGSWITFGTSLNSNGIKKCMRAAFDAGVNFFDNAEAYAGGASELLMGEVLKEYRREDLVVSTKIFWGGNGPNDTGLSMKHLIEGTKGALKRMQLDYVDLLYCHRPDPTTPIEETVRAMDIIIRSGLAFYWGTSEWSAKDLIEAYEVAKEIGAIPPTMEQPEYNMFRREKVEDEFAPLYAKYGLGTTTWSPLESGILTGKYNDTVPKGSRLHLHPELRGRLTEEKVEKLRRLKIIADDLGCTMAQMAIAWCLKNPNVSSVITGASNVEQVQDNMEAIKIKHLLSEEQMQGIETILS